DDGVGADRAAGRGRGAVDGGDRIAVLQAGDAAGQCRVGGVQCLRLVVCRDRQRGPGHGQGPVHERDRVVVQAGARAGSDVCRDRVGADAGRLVCGGGVAVDEVIAVLRAGDGAGQGGVGVAVGLGLVVGCDGERCFGDGEGGVDELDVVVAEAGAGAGCDVRGDRVAADATRRIGGGGVAVDEVVAVLGAGDGAGQGGVG